MTNLGPAAEELVADHLRERGYTILGRNVVIGRIGELDIVARDDQEICFIEVRSRRSSRLGHPWETVGAEKQRKLRRLAEIFLARQGFDGPARFDVASVVWPNGENPVIEYFEDAFE